MAGRAVGGIDDAHGPGYSRGLRQLDPLAGGLAVRGVEAPRGGHPARGVGVGRRGDAEHLRRARGAELQLGGGHVLPRTCYRRDPDRGGRQGTPADPRGSGRGSAAGCGRFPDTRDGGCTRPSHDGQRGGGPPHRDRAGVPHRPAAGPLRPLHQGVVQHLPLRDVPSALPDPPCARRGSPRPAGGGGEGRRRADPGLLLLDEPGVHPWPALAPAQGRAVPGAVGCGRDPPAQAVQRRGRDVRRDRRRAGGRGHADVLGPLDHQHRRRAVGDVVLRR